MNVSLRFEEVKQARKLIRSVTAAFLDRHQRREVDLDLCMVRCGVVWHGVVWCGAVWCGAVRCGVV